MPFKLPPLLFWQLIAKSTPRTASLLAFFVGTAVALGQAGDLGFARDIKPILDQHCVECHQASDIKGNIRLDIFSDAVSILERRDSWRRVLEVLDFEEMPPEPDKTHFTDRDSRILMSWIKDKVLPIDRHNPIYLDPGPSLVRQLTATEYQRTIKDLLGINFDVTRHSGLKDEYFEYVYTTNAANQTMDPTTFERYFKAAEEVLAQLFSDPLGSWKAGPPRPWNQHQLMEAEAKAAREQLFAIGGGEETRKAAEAILIDFVTRALRRPVGATYAPRLLQVFDQSIAKGESFENALRAAMHPVLTSPAFLFKIEIKDVGSQEPYVRVDDFELATRLSYFIWASTPDRTLLDLAAEGKLADPQVLREQVRRMLADERASSLVEIFANQWLQLHHLDKALPTARYFPLYTATMPQSMRREVFAFLNYVRTEDRPITDMLHADYTFVNEDLAKLYEIPDVTGPELRKVSLKPEYNRGGLVGMGAILTMTSHTNRTKPTSRGKWVLDAIFGTPPPPPPANVEAIAETPPNAEKPATFRQKLDQHASDPTCRICHNRIDPLGFAMENYNGIGQWRTQDGGLPVDNSGALPSGEKLVGIVDLKKVFFSRRDQFTENVIRQMLTYALGREMRFTDELTISGLTEYVIRNDYRFSAVVEGIAISRPFQFKRTAAHDNTLTTASISNK